MVQVIERTGKQWKIWKLSGFLACFIFGPASCIMSESAGLGWIIFLLGMCAFIYGCVGAWWYHG
jgi:hypothetical protein